MAARTEVLAMRPQAGGLGRGRVFHTWMAIAILLTTFAGFGGATTYGHSPGLPRFRLSYTSTPPSSQPDVRRIS